MSFKDLQNIDNFITMQDVHKLIKNNNSIKQLYKEIEEYKEKNTIDKIKYLLGILGTRIKTFNKVEKINKKGKTHKAFEGIEDEFNDFLEISTKLIFFIRQFLLGEDITILMAVRNSEGKLLGVREKKISEIIADGSIKAKINEEGIYLDREISNIRKEEKIKKNYNKGWNKLLKLIGINKENGKLQGIIDGYEKVEEFPYYNKTYQRYRHSKNSQRFFITKQKKEDLKDPKVKRLYYDPSDNFSNTNISDMTILSSSNAMGWLFEWYMEWAYDKKESTITHMSQDKFLDNILKGKKIDSIEGIKQGDFLTKQNKWIQAKYGNLKLISFNSIEKIIMKLQLSFESMGPKYLTLDKFVGEMANLYTDAEHEKTNKDFQKKYEDLNKVIKEISKIINVTMDIH